MKYRTIVYTILAGGGLALAAAGCASNRTTLAEPDEEQELATYQKEPGTKSTVEVSKSKEGYTPKVLDQARIIETAFPTGQKGSSAILLQQVVPLEVLRNAEYLYEYHVTNLTTIAHDHVTLSLDDLSNINVVRSTPKAIDDKGRMRWELGELGPKETKIINVYATSESLEPATSCVSVTYDTGACAQIKVIEPNLLLVKTATSDGTLCDDFTMHYEVTNPGTGMARNVMIKDTLPEGLRTHKDERVVQIAAGNVKPGEKKVFDVKTKAIRTGKHQSFAVATGEGGLESKSQNIQTIVYQAALKVTAESSGQEYIGRDITYRFTVKNTGDTPAVDTALEADIPAAAQFVRATEGGTSRANKVQWMLGSLAPGASKAFEMRVKPAGVGSMPTTARATARCAQPATASASTSIVGIAAVLLEVVDAGDPAELGSQVTYTITATNQGSAADSGIIIACDLPAEQQYVSSDGPTRGVLAGRELTFAPLRTLAPGERAQWRVIIRAQSEGDLRFRAWMTSDQLGGVPVQETEATTQYK